MRERRESEGREELFREVRTSEGTESQGCEEVD